MLDYRRRRLDRDVEGLSFEGVMVDGIYRAVRER